MTAQPTDHDRPRLYHPLRCGELAQTYGAYCELLVAEHAPQVVDAFALWLDELGLALLAPGQRRPFRLEVSSLRRRAQPRSLLTRACAADQRPRILDAFSGFGLDGLALALRGCAVTTVERQLLVYLMQRDLAARAQVGADVRYQDVCPLLRANSEQWEVVYLDPMFEPRRKHALPNLGMQYLQSLAAQAPIDQPAALEHAMATATRRVVLKRRLRDPVLARPNHQLRGRAIRFDVYVKG